MAFVLLVAMLVIGAAIAAVQLAKQRDQRARQVAAHAGLLINTSRLDPPDARFDVFTTGRARRVQYVMWGRDDPHHASVFQYQYTVGSGDNSTTHRFTCAYVDTGLHAPGLRITPEGFVGSLLRAVGMRDIEVESPTFNERYRVRCDDDRFAITLLDPPMVGWFLERGESLSYQLAGDRALIVSRQLRVDELPGLLDHAREFASRLPKVLGELYPGPR